MGFNPAGGALSGASDVALSNPANTHVMSFNGAVAKWQNQAIGTANGIATLNGSSKVPDAQLSHPIITVADGAALPTVVNGAILYIYDPSGTI